MGIDAIVASSTAVVDTTGGYLIASIVGVFPVLLKYVIPLALVFFGIFVLWRMARHRG